MIFSTWGTVWYSKVRLQGKGISSPASRFLRANAPGQARLVDDERPARIALQVLLPRHDEGILAPTVPK